MRRQRGKFENITDGSVVVRVARSAVEENLDIPVLLRLSRRRERIERLEREVSVVEEMAPAAVEKYSTTARYGRSNTDAAARTLQGVFRYSTL